jgi:dihydroorotase
VKPGILIVGGRIVDPAGSLDALRDLRIRDGRIVEIGEHLSTTVNEERLDATGCIVAPGLIDMHVHLRDPGYPEKETLETGTEAAVRGGFTAVACMPNTNPALDAPEVLAALQERIARMARCRVYPIGAMTVGRHGHEPCDYASLAEAGAVGFSDDGDTLRDETVLFDGAQRARDIAGPFISHCEPEDAIVARDLGVAARTGKSWHVAHCSTKTALDLIRQARDRGTRVTCEATPHHLTFTAAEVAAEMGPAARVNPPLRDTNDVEALRSGVFDGTVDVLASDHAPHTMAEKVDRDRPAPGFTGLEIALGAYGAALDGLPLSRFIALVSTNPARILDIAGGTLAVGAPADVTIFAERSWTVDPSTFASKGHVTPFAGRRLPLKAMATIVGGDVRYCAPEFAA